MTSPDAKISSANSLSLRPNPDGDAIANNEPKMPELVDLYAMVSRMRVLAMPRTVARADSLMHAIIDTYFRPNRTMRDLHDMLQTGAGIDPLREFSEAAREELTAFASR